ncbi:glycoside hydrolase family 3 N-terminal domain-containing protein [Synoicihabitans lomoniglobus]|uniref:Glycoside hydrolase family 3 N-terminal domain-containing protein n=1 Tax=Synoicihabitans lomoniglobus TaxID=2909285 RepID=A0AAE9ZXI8_9BACT|nr:glycoside hydrolase family 3 C-terminal domain-containing protein [Opitutaceae bacterium LMO-M01]WED65094.1 glycoside hydrolase family 3 N-terminal domain-containing protein [Opitutaceae bacterium LMO-M01]
MSAYPFQDPSLPVSDRINDLLSRLTLEEKVNQLLHENKAIPRLDVPEYNWWNEACHGIGRNGRATVFPQGIAMGATFNRDLIRQVASVISDEAQAKHHAALRAGRRGQYQGLTFWTPNINIFRDPRWGRGMETFGEDPYLMGELGVAVVEGLQGQDERFLKAAACAKHYAVHSGPEQDRHKFDARPTRKDLRETYLPAFKKLVDAGVETVMGAYNRVDGEPACGSKQLLVDILRDEWKFQGHVVSDCWALLDFHVDHQVTKTAAESAALALKNGCDLNCGCTYNDLLTAVSEGLVSEADVDVSVRRLLSTKFRLGLLDPTGTTPWADTPIDIVDSAEHRDLARRTAIESMVLLKNKDNLLPLRDDPDGLLVCGPLAGGVGALLGNYYGVSGRLVTYTEGVNARVAEGVRIEYRHGCPLQGAKAPGVNYTFGAADRSEVVIAVLGTDHTLEGEEGDAVASASGGDRDFIELPASQIEFLKELRTHAKHLVVVLTGGGALAVPEVQELADAVIQVWYSGCEGGTALANVLFGDAAPSGKLPVTVPYATADLPPFEDYAMQGRTYRFATKEPLYPFGFGLSYGELSYGPLETTTELDGSIIATTTLTNRGYQAVSETVQCYIQPPTSWADAPVATLVDFQKLHLPAGQTAPVVFTLRPEALYQVDAQGKHVPVVGDYGLVIGSASPGPRAIALGAPAPATTTVTIA